MKKKKSSRPKPIWKTVKVEKPFCPICGNEMLRATGDVASMFSWQCRSLVCHYVC